MLWQPSIGTNRVWNKFNPNTDRFLIGMEYQTTNQEILMCIGFPEIGTRLQCVGLVRTLRRISQLALKVRRMVMRTRTLLFCEDAREINI